MGTERSRIDTDITLNVTEYKRAFSRAHWRGARRAPAG